MEPIKPKIHWEITRGYGDCDDCGGYDWANAEVIFDDGTKLELQYDGHLGGGNWDGSAGALALYCLEKLGYTLQVNGDDIEHLGYYVNDYSRGWRELVKQVLYSGAAAVLKVVYAETDDDDCETPIEVTLTMPDGRELRLSTSEEGLYFAVLGAFADVTTTEHAESEEYD